MKLKYRHNKTSARTDMNIEGINNLLKHAGYRLVMVILVNSFRIVSLISLKNQVNLLDYVHINQLLIVTKIRYWNVKVWPSSCANLIVTVSLIMMSLQMILLANAHILISIELIQKKWILVKSQLKYHANYYLIAN